MPAWLISFLISLAVRLGLPWLLKKFPWLPPEVVKIIEELVGKLNSVKSDKKKAVHEAKRKVKAHCDGVGCPTDTKGLG